MLRNDIFAGPGTPCDSAGAIREANFAGDPKFANAAGYDYTLLAGSPAIDHGADPGVGGGERLDPDCQYEDIWVVQGSDTVIEVCWMLARAPHRRMTQAWTRA